MVCNGCHDLLIISPGINSTAIITVKGVDYRFIICDVSKSNGLHLLVNSLLQGCGFMQNSFQRNQYLK